MIMDRVGKNKIKLENGILYYIDEFSDENIIVSLDDIISFDVNRGDSFDYEFEITYKNGLIKKFKMNLDYEIYKKVVNYIIENIKINRKMKIN